MSLVGNLEDLGLGDILQIVSLSRKSGVLHLRCGDRAGTIVFFNGQVVQATSSDSHPDFGQLLVERQLISAGQLRDAQHQSRASGEPLSKVLTDRYEIDQDVVEQVLREQIEQIVYSFFSWTEGTFAFELYEAEEIQGEADPESLFDRGINPQWLAMEGSRRLDEQRHQQQEAGQGGAAVLSEGDDYVPEQVLPPEAPPPGSDTGAEGLGSGSLLYLVDDDARTRRLLADALKAHGFSVSTFPDGRACLTGLENLGEASPRPHLVVDLIMPRIDGSGILGGLELVERTSDHALGNPLVVLTDHANPEAEKMLADKGVRHLLRKPKKDDLNTRQGLAALDRLAGQIAAILGKKPKDAVKTPPGLVHLGRELLSEIGEEGMGEPGTDRPGSTSSPGLSLLKGMLQELNNPTLGGGVILLVLRFASEIMNRAVVFLVRDDAIVGLGQFGLEQCVADADRKVRRMKLPLDQPSVLTRALEAKSAVRLPFSDSEWDRYLQEQLGGERPEEAFIGPIFSEGRVVALLYGDNLPAQQGVGDTEALEIFLSQAGLAMEKALLERRLQLQGRNGS